MSLVVGENVGPYRIVEQLGQGGMATVFKAYHAALDRYVAIKVLHPAFKEDQTFLARFQREARVVARLEHPNIVPVYDFAEHNGAPYLVMKFIEGETLKARLTRGPLTLKETLRILEAVGAGLDYAHRQGILHRDIKSSNIMLAADGNVYLADFGLARIAMAGESTLSLDSMIGTPHYMSPEQAKGVKDLDAGTDIYSLGVVLYELVVGRLPYSADTPFAIIHDHIYTPLPMPRSANPNVSESIERVLLKALAKERADRYPDVAAMVGAFREAVAGAESGVVALPAGVPVSPSAPTAPAATTTASPKATADAAPTQVASAPKARSGYQFRWWHAALAVVLLLVCGLLALAAINANRQRPRAGAASATLAAAQATTAPTLVVAQNTPAPLANTPRATAAPTLVAQNTPAPPAWLPMAEEAAKLYQTGSPKEALALLNEIVRTNPGDPGAHLIAGDLTLANGLTLDALSLFYLPGVALNPDAKDGVFLSLREHAALAYYVAAADRDAEKFLLDNAGALGDPTGNLAYQRWRLFHGDVETARIEIESILEPNPNADGPLLVYGDYLLKVGKFGEALLRYEGATRNPPGTRAPTRWIKLEAECRQRVLREQRNEAQLTATCEPVVALLQPESKP